jgi:predicted lipid carrier protein YhbT
MGVHLDRFQAAVLRDSAALQIQLLLSEAFKLPARRLNVHHVRLLALQWQSSARHQHTLVTDQCASDVEVLATNNNDLLALEQLLGNCRGQAAHEVTAGVDHDDLLAEMCIRE